MDINKSDNNSTLSCKSGDEIVVTLPENPTTGFTWHIVKSSGLKMIDDTFNLDSHSSSNQMGHGGNRILKFKYEGPSEGLLVLKYYQAWEGIESAEDSFTVHFT